MFSMLSRIGCATWQSSQYFPPTSEASAVTALRRELDDYRDAGMTLLSVAGQAGALGRYHKQVNPLLRRAVASCARN